MKPVKTMTRQKIQPAWDDSRRGWLVCAWYEKIGPKSLAKLQAAFGQDGGLKAFQADKGQLVSAGLTESTATGFIGWRQTNEPEKLISILGQEGIDFVLPWDTAYPNAFRQSSIPPTALFWRGAPVPTRPCVAVVGTRHMTTYGERATRQIVGELAERDACIVSGLALGVDSMAHQMALESNAPTVALLGGGLDRASLYPKSNAPLAERILLSGGALASEFAPGTPALKQNFPQRNRLIAALSQSVVVIEAGLESGSVLTAKLALEEGREVFAVPGPITSQYSLGTNTLIKNGAHVCLSGQDVLSSAQTVSTQSEAYERQLSTEERRILDLCRTTTHADDLARFLNAPAATISSACMQLELMGALVDTGGHNYELTAKGNRLLRSQKAQDTETESRF